MKDLIEPTEYSLDFNQIREDLIRSGVLESDSSWLAEIMSRDDFLIQPEDQADKYDRVEVLETLSQFMGECFKDFYGNRNAALSLILISWLGLRNDYHRALTAIRNESEKGLIPFWIEIFIYLEPAIDWINGIVEILKTGRDSKKMRLDESRILNFFLNSGVMNQQIKHSLLSTLIGSIDTKHIIEAADETGWNGGVFNNTERIEYWLKYDVPGMLFAFLERFRKTDDSLIGKLAFGIYKIIGRMFDKSMRGESTTDIEVDKIIDVMQKYFVEIELRYEKLPNDKWIQKALWKFAQPIHWFPFYGNVNGFCLNDKQTKYSKEATAILGRLRSLISKGNEQNNVGEFDRDYYDSIWSFLLHSENAWIALKPLLIAFSNLTEQAVASDLRYWNEQNRESLPDSTWVWIPERIASTIHGLKGEQSEDPDLIHVRTSFAEYCLSRLKTRRKIEQRDERESRLSDEDFLEPRDIWRKAYIRAVGELRINPKGKGHHILFWVSQNDPHNDVRQIAASTYKMLRHNPEWQKGLSPRRALFGAFWWLRQAHLLSLGIEVDPNGAQRTRSKEITWTTKLEQ